MVNGAEHAAAVFTDRTRDRMPADSCCNAKLASHRFSEATGREQGLPDLGPPRRRKLTDDGPDSISLRKGHMVEVQCARHWHPVLWAKHEFGIDTADSASRRHNDQLADAIDEFGSRENQNGSALVRDTKRVPTDLTTFHPTASQPSASQLSGS
jgi:hypothetical protein